MKSFLLAFAANLIGGFFAYLAVSVLARFEPKTSPDFSSSGIILYEKSRTIRFASALVISAWSLYLVVFFSLITLIVLNITGTKKIEIMLIFLFGALAAAMVCSISYLVLAPSLRCKKCRRRVTVQWTYNLPPYSKRVWKMKGWGAVILDVVLNRRFRCMYCGQAYSVEAPNTIGS